MLLKRNNDNSLMKFFACDLTFFLSEGLESFILGIFTISGCVYEYAQTCTEGCQTYKSVCQGKRERGLSCWALVKLFCVFKLWTKLVLIPVNFCLFFLSFFLEFVVIWFWTSLYDCLCHDLFLAWFRPPHVFLLHFQPSYLIYVLTLLLNFCFGTVNF